MTCGPPIKRRGDGMAGKREERCGCGGGFSFGSLWFALVCFWGCLFEREFKGVGDEEGGIKTVQE